MVRMTRAALALALASFLAPSLAGCGTAPGSNALDPSTSAQAVTNRPIVPSVDLAALAQTRSGLSAKDVGTVSEAKSLATNALYEYNNLRNEWLSTYDDTQRDNIEQEMLQVLTSADSDIRNATNNGCCDSDNQYLFSISNSSLEQYSSLDSEWSSTWDVNQRRQIANQMLVVLTQALMQINNYVPTSNPYNPYLSGKPSGLTATPASPSVSPSPSVNP
ncbi:MAG: hypothetical protein KGR26_06745 [Cyanobacteria bacterium REEB65]|nr:hypothetical protein [Cyanobacteria bacterium REEB65]